MIYRVKIFVLNLFLHYFIIATLSTVKNLVTAEIIICIRVIQKEPMPDIYQ